MTKTVDDILAEEMGRLGGFLSALVSRRMPNNIGEVSRTIDAPPDGLLAVASALFTEQGRLLEQGPAAVTGVIGGGKLGLNPVHVTVEARSEDGGPTTLFIRAVAKEGLVKQYAGEKAAPLVAELILRTTAS